MNRIAGLLLAMLAAATFVSCGGQSSPPPPSATPAADPADSPAGDANALPPGHPPIGATPPSGAGAAAASAGAIAGTISVSPKVQGRTAPSDVLYVIARKDGATLAVQRVENPQFPMAFELSGADAMVPETAFQGKVELVARLSKSGDAMASAGDLEGTTSGVAVPSNGVTVTIDRVRE